MILLLSALDFMVGSFITTPEEGFDGWGSGNFIENLWPKYQDGITWFTVFGVFFPTITGVLSGINMSGDLRAPSTGNQINTKCFLILLISEFLNHFRYTQRHYCRIINVNRSLHDFPDFPWSNCAERNSPCELPNHEASRSYQLSPSGGHLRQFNELLSRSDVWNTKSSSIHCE